MATNNNEYTAKNIKKLEPRDHVRHRVGMYLGSNSDDGMTVSVRELADNSVDECLAGHGNEVILTFHADGSAEVQDYGRGLPIDKNDEGINGIILTLGTIGSGGKFNSDNYAASGGLNGVGASAAIATAKAAHITVYRGGNMYKLSFKEGLPGFFADEENPDSKFSANTELKVSKDPRSASDKKKNPTGTNVRFWPDFAVFLPGSKFLVDDIKFRMRSTAFLVPGISITVNDLRDSANPVHDTYNFPGGIEDMLPTMTHHNFVTKPIHIKTEGSFNEVATVMNSNGKMGQAEVTRNVSIDVAFAYTGEEDTTLKSYVNIINTKNGGKHEEGLWRAMSRILINHAKSVKGKGFLGAKEEAPTLEDVKDGFTGIISISFPEPTFSGQEKGRLETPQITSVISQTVGSELKSWLENKKNDVQAKLIAKRIIDASRIRIAARQQKETARKKSALETSTSMPSKLVACASTDSSLIELQICEGDSAMGGLKLSRDSNTTAIYPLKGKPLNTYGMPLGEIIKNQEWSDLIQIIGAGMGKEFDVNQMRYGKIVILADGDADGSHIRALLLAGFWRLMRPMVEAGCVYVALPPLFSITVKGRKVERHYALNQEELDPLVAKLTKAGKKWDKIQRHKGLGEYSPDDLVTIVMNPETRVLKQITVEDVEHFESTLELTLGKNAANRRKWITDNHDLVSEDDIDVTG
jgi:DNA gyrase subunit B